MTEDGPVQNEVLFMRDVDGTGSMHPCWPDAEGVVAYIRADLVDAIRLSEDDGLPLSTWAHAIVEATA